MKLATIPIGGSGSGSDKSVEETKLQSLRPPENMSSVGAVKSHEKLESPQAH